MCLGRFSCLLCFVRVHKTEPYGYRKINSFKMNNDIYDNSEDGAIITREEYTVQLRNWISQVKTHNEQALNELFRSYAAHCNTQTTQAQSPNTLTNTNHSHNFVFVHTSRPCN